VVCGELKFHDKRRDTITNAAVIVEVLSKSTERFDRGRKFELYKEIETLTDYLLVAQDAPRIEHYRRQPGGEWVLTVAEGLHGTVDIPSIGCELLLSDVYDRIIFQSTGH
jgi:Uma2 family endonuclease